MANERLKTPTLIETLQEVIEARICELHTSLPCEIVSYDHAKNLAVVQPLLKRKYKNEAEAVKLPIITNVPIAFQRMNDAHLRLPVKAGDTGHLIFNERSIDTWLVQGGAIDPNDPRKHSINDAVFYPGLNPNNKTMSSTAPSSSLELKYKTAYVEIAENGKIFLKNSSSDVELASDGKITLKNSGGAKYELLTSGKFKMTNGAEELFTELVQLVTDLIAAQTTLGAQFDAGTIANLNQRLTKLTSLKG